MCFITETCLTKGKKIEIKDFRCFNFPYSDYNDKKPRGGSMCYISNSFMKYVSNVDGSNPDNIVVMLHGGHKIFSCYIPPSDSRFFQEEQFTVIPNLFKLSNKEEVIIGGGDLNCRIGDTKQKLNLTNSYYYNNPDNVVNSHGRVLNQLCKSF